MNQPISFEKGFPLEEPNIILPWGKPLGEVAAMSGGIRQEDCYIWNGVKYLDGLDFLLSSDPGLDSKMPFKEISAYIGLNPDMLWSDPVAFAEYKKVAEHLIKLFGEPQKREKNSEVPETEILTWEFGQIQMYLIVIEQFAYKCYLTVWQK